MAKISDLTAITTIADNHVLVINDGTPTTKKITVASLKSQLGLPSRFIYANISQTSTDAPTMTIIKNTLGYTPTFLYDNVGSYSMLFDESVTPASWTVVNGGDKYPYNTSVRISGGGVKIETYNGSTKADGILLDLSVKIEVYE